MKSGIHFLVLFLIASLAGCKKNAHDHTHGEEVLQGPNKELYDQVMAIHDEVMPKMDDLYKAKTALKTRLELPGISEDEKQKIQQRITGIDSASEGMMVWMRQFNPIADSLGEDKARAYLEQELVKVQKVRDDILQALKESE